MTTATELIRELQADPALAAQVRGAILGEELLGLPAIVARMAEAQAELVSAQAELAAAQARTEASLVALTERVDRLAGEVDRLAGEVDRLAGEVDRLAGEVDRLAGEMDRLRDGLWAAMNNLRDGLWAAMNDLQDSLWAAMNDLRDGVRREIGLMSQAFGSTAEEEATDALLDALEADGYSVHGEPTINLRVDGQELDVAVSATGPDGASVSAVVEAKVRLGAGEVRRFAAKIEGPLLRDQLAAAGFPRPWLAFVYGMRVDGRAREAAAELGVGVLAHAGGRAVVAPRLMAA